MEKPSELTELFEANRSHLRAVAYRMLGSLAEADDAIQKAWLRMDHSGATGIRNIRGWLTTIVARVCLDMLRSRNSLGEEALDARPVEPSANSSSGNDPEQEALLADSVGAALLVVLDTLAPAERGAPAEIRGAQNWAKGALAFSRSARFVQPALINGAVGLVLASRGRLSRALNFEIDDGKIVRVEIIGERERLRRLDLSVFNARPDTSDVREP